jgi:hypothetical protein
MVVLWMSDFEDATLAVLDVCIYTKIDCLHGRGAFFTGEAHQRAQRDLDGIVRVALRSIQHVQKSYRGHVHGAQTLQPDAASLCRFIRSFNTRICYCEHPFARGASEVPHNYANRGCLQVNTAVAPDLLERHTYMETKLSICRAVGGKLPKELFDMILRYALLAQEVPQEPGVFIDLERLSSSAICIRSRSRGAS